MRIWNPAAECMPPEKLRVLQLERMKKQVETAWTQLPYYAEKMRQAGITPQDIQSLDDVRYLPLTEKEDLRQQYPYKTFAVPLREVVRLHASTGTTGKPTVVGYTRNDMENWTELVARLLVAGGLSANDVLQIAFGYGLFTGGFGLHYGAERVGATVIPASSGNTERQLLLLRDLQVTALVCTPTYAVYLGEALQSEGIDPRDLSLKYGFFGGEFWTDAIRQKIESLLGICATDNYGLSEVMGPGVSGECLEKNGLHVAEDHFLFEIVSPETMMPVEDGETGEVVITPLTKEAIPVIRYRTRDISRLFPDACPCGRTLRRMEKVVGRTDDMLIIRGVNVFPSQVEHILLQYQDTAPHYQLIASRDDSLDLLEVKVEASEALFSDQMRQMTELRNQIQEQLNHALGLKVKLTLVEPDSLERFSGKAKRVLDQRKF